MSSGYGFWLDMSMEDFLNGTVKSANNYIIYSTNVWTELFSIFFVFILLMLLIVEKKYALWKVLLYSVFKSQTKNRWIRLSLKILSQNKTEDLC